MTPSVDMQFVGAFAKFAKRKAAVSFMSVRPSVLTVHLGFHWTDFHAISYLSIFRKSIKKIQFSLKSGKNTGFFT